MLKCVENMTCWCRVTSYRDWIEEKIVSGRRCQNWVWSLCLLYLYLKLLIIYNKGHNTATHYQEKPNKDILSSVSTGAATETKCSSQLRLGLLVFLRNLSVFFVTLEKNASSEGDTTRGYPGDLLEMEKQSSATFLLMTVMRTWREEMTLDTVC